MGLFLHIYVIPSKALLKQGKINSWSNQEGFFPFGLIMNKKGIVYMNNIIGKIWENAFNEPIPEGALFGLTFVIGIGGCTIIWFVTSVVANLR